MSVYFRKLNIYLLANNDLVIFREQFCRLTIPERRLRKGYGAAGLGKVKI